MLRHRPRAAILAAVLGCVIPAVSLAAPSPAALLGSILAAGRAQHSVHYVSKIQLGTVRIAQVADVGATKGIQRITYSKAGTTGHVTVVVSAGRAYVRGDA